MVWAIIGVLIMIPALLVIPLGLPGLWIMVAVLAGGALLGEVGLAALIGALVLAVAAEAAEFVFVKRLNHRYGGSRRAFWGALAGGIAGVLIGLPIPVVGSVVAGVLGSFAGAAAVTLWETRRLRSAARVGWGVLLGRTFAIAAKMGAGVVILVIGAGALLFA
ncbi:MAG TPA: DUF456 domain-containing protein [Longimicrobiales bacterium]